MIKEFRNLVNVIKEKRDRYMINDLESLNDDMEAFGSYVQQVYHQNCSAPIKYATLEGEELRNAIQEMDISRRRKHEAAIAACSTINKTCEYYGVPKMCPETDDRYVIADFCAQVTAEFYLDGLNKSIDTIDKVISAMGEAGLYVKLHDVIDINDLSSVLDELDDITEDQIPNTKYDKEAEKENVKTKTTADWRMLEEGNIR